MAVEHEGLAAATALEGGDGLKSAGVDFLEFNAGSRETPRNSARKRARSDSSVLKLGILTMSWARSSMVVVSDGVQEGFGVGGGHGVSF